MREIECKKKQKNVKKKNKKGLAIEDSERRTLKQDLGEADVCILRNHGLLSVGKTVGEAYIRMHYAHMAAELQVIIFFF